MANTVPTKLTIIQKVNLLFRFFFAVSSFKSLEEEDNDLQNQQEKTSPSDRADILRNALFKSFLIISISGTAGIVIGYILRKYYPHPIPLIILSIQMLSALILLWATLAIRGWDIQSYGGVTYTERINTFIFRSFYFVGTLLLIVTMVWKI